MGYDYPDCIVCYCRAGFNQTGDSNIVSVCKECMSDLVQLQGRASVHAEEMFRENVICKGCNKREKGYIFIPLCKEHKKELEREK